MIRISLIFLLATEPDFIMNKFNNKKGRHSFVSVDVNLISSFHYVIDNRKFGLMQFNVRVNKFSFLRDESIIPLFCVLLPLRHVICSQKRPRTAESLLFNSTQH